MNDLIPFLLDHWVLSGLFLATLFLLLSNEWQLRSAGLPRLSPQEVVAWINHQRARVVDTRALEVYQAGHITEALSWPVAAVEDKLKSLKNKQLPVVVVCQQGAQAGGVAQKLQAAGFERVAILSGGMQAWLAENLPVVSKAAKKQ